MRLLLVNDNATSVGGAEAQFHWLAAALRARGHDVRTFASSAGLIAGADHAADATCFGTTSRWRTLVQAANPGAYVALRREVRDFRPDVVHLQMFLTQLSPLVLRALRGVPVLHHAVWYRAVCPKGTLLLKDGSACAVKAGAVCATGGCLPARDVALLVPQIRLARRWWGAIDRTYAVSDAVAQRLRQRGVTVDGVIYGGVPECNARAPLHGSPTVAYAGRLVKEKGVDVLLHAFAAVRAALPEARLLVAGDGPDRECLQQLAAQLGIAEQAHFAGHVPNAELESLLGDAWVHAVPSVWDEPFGLVAVEAMMRGTAVVASDVGGLPEAVGRDSGALVPPGDVRALADALVGLLGDRERCEREGARARSRALAGFTTAGMAQRFAEAYRSMLPEGAAVA